MYRFLVLVLICELVCAKSFAQKLSIKIKENTTYNAIQKKYDSTKLVWTDFKALIPEAETNAAVTVINTNYTTRISKTPKEIKVVYSIKFYFNRASSSKKKSITSAEVLRHEQIHFDIAWYYYQLFLKEIHTTEFTLENYKTIFEQKFKTYLANAKDFQALYDDETAHSTIAEKQLEWETKVAEMLTQLNQTN
jgi:hypothetical protein